MVENRRIATVPPASVAPDREEVKKRARNSALLEMALLTPIPSQHVEIAASTQRLETIDVQESSTLWVWLLVMMKTILPPSWIPLPTCWARSWWILRTHWKVQERRRSQGLPHDVRTHHWWGWSLCLPPLQAACYWRILTARNEWVTGILIAFKEVLRSLRGPALNFKMQKSIGSLWPKKSPSQSHPCPLTRLESQSRDHTRNAVDPR